MSILPWIKIKFRLFPVHEFLSRHWEPASINRDSFFSYMCTVFLKKRVIQPYAPSLGNNCVVFPPQNSLLDQLSPRSWNLECVQVRGNSGWITDKNLITINECSNEKKSLLPQSCNNLSYKGKHIIWKGNLVNISSLFQVAVISESWGREKTADFKPYL